MHEQSSHAGIRHPTFYPSCGLHKLHSHRNERLHDYLLICFLHPTYPVGIRSTAYGYDILAPQVGDARALGRDDSQRFCHIFGFHAGDVVSVENDFSGITPVQTGYGAEQRRFSCPVSSDKGCQLTFFLSWHLPRGATSFLCNLWKNAVILSCGDGFVA